MSNISAFVEFEITIFIFSFTAQRKSEVIENLEDDESMSIAEFTEKNKYWFIGAGIVALMILAFIQCLVTMCRRKRNEPPPVSSKVSREEQKFSLSLCR